MLFLCEMYSNFGGKMSLNAICRLAINKYKCVIKPQHLKKMYGLKCKICYWGKNN